MLYNDYSIKAYIMQVIFANTSFLISLFEGRLLMRNDQDRYQMSFVLLPIMFILVFIIIVNGILVQKFLNKDAVKQQIVVVNVSYDNNNKPIVALNTKSHNLQSWKSPKDSSESLDKLLAPEPVEASEIQKKVIAEPEVVVSSSLNGEKEKAEKQENVKEEVSKYDSLIKGDPSLSLNSEGKLVYTVKSGDNLTNIASKYGVDLNELIKVNNIVNVNLIYPNSSLVLPGI